MADIRYNFDADPSDLLSALGEINREMEDVEKSAEDVGKAIDKSTKKSGVSFADLEKATGQVDQGINGLKKSMELAAAAVGAVAGAIAALTKGALDEAQRQVDGLTNATDKQVASSALLLNQQEQTIGTLKNLRTEALSPLIPVVANTAAGLEALAEQFTKTGEAAVAGEELATFYRESLIPAISAFGITGEIVYKKLAALINQTIELNKTLFFSMTFQWKKARDAAADAQQGWEDANIEGIVDKWGSWQDIILETNAALDGTVGSTAGATKGIDALSSALDAFLNAAYGVTEDLALSFMTADQQIIESGERRKSALEDQADKLLRNTKLSANQRYEIEDALSEALFAIDEETASKLAALQKMSDEEDAARRRAEADKILEDKQKLEDDKLAIAEEAAEKQREIEQGMYEFSVSLLQSLQEISDLVYEDKVSKAATTADEIEAIDEKLAGTLTESERNRLEEQRAQKKALLDSQREAASRAFEASQASAVAQAAIATALAVIQGLQAGLSIGGPQGIALGLATSIAAGIAGAASIATIASEPAPTFHTGGMASDEFYAVMRRGEEKGVLSPQGVNAAGGPQGVQALNQGRGGGNRPIVTVFRVENKAVDAMMTNNLRTRRGPLSRNFRAVQPTRVKVTGHHNPWAV